jgi:hypothetical protein
MAIGITDLKQVIRIPATWDLSYMRQWQTKDGMSFDQLVSRMGGALTLFNRSLTQGYWAQYYYSTTAMESEYPVGGDSNELEKVSEYTRPDPLLGESSGHMLPMHDYGGAMSWTYMAMRRGTADKLLLGVRRLIERGQNTWQKRLLERLFTNTAETVGNTGVSVPFADGGVADSAYIPPYSDGRTFLNTHNHFGCQADSEAGREAAALAGFAHLREHGIMPPYELVIPEADITDWYGSDNFVVPQRGAILTAGLEVRGSVDESMYVGLWETSWGVARVRVEPRLPANYMGLFKPQGNGSPMNPLVVRYEDGYPLGLALVGEVKNFPLEDAIAYFTFGVGVANRVAGYCSFFDAGGLYTSPTIT